MTRSFSVAGTRRLCENRQPLAGLSPDSRRTEGSTMSLAAHTRFSLVFGLISLHWFSQSGFGQSTAQPAAAAPQQSSATQVAAEAGKGSSTPRANTSFLPIDVLGQARASYRRGDFEVAIAKYKEYLKDHPQLPDGYTGIVRVYLKQKKCRPCSTDRRRGACPF
jgi:hypothetical protein